MKVPTPEEVRCRLSALDARQQKLVGGMLAVMMGHPDRVRDREWISEQLTQLSLLAAESTGELESHPSDQGLAELQVYLRENIDVLMNASFALFLRVGEDLAPRAAEGFSFEEAMAQAMGYFS